MQVPNEQLYGNVLRVNFKVNSGSNLLSPEYFINNTASFQVSIKYPNIYVKFAKLYINDPVNYSIKVSCDEFSIKKRIINQPNMWHVLHVATTTEIAFELIVYLEPLSDANSFASLHTDAELTDFELHGEDGFVELHKVVMAVSSPVFRKMVSGKWREAKECQVEIKGISKTTLQHLKDYMYLHTLPDTGLEELLLLASCYMMPDLEQKCVDKLVVNMTVQNTGELLKFATQHELTRLLLAILGSCSNGSIDVMEMWEHFYGSKH